MADIPIDQDEHNTSSGDEEALNGLSSTFAATSFDQYFLWSSKTAKTSSNVYSSRIPPISAEEYTSATSSYLLRSARFFQSTPPAYHQFFPQWLKQLEESFSLLLYGAGSKREVLNEFALYIHNSRTAYVHVVNTFRPTFTFRDFLASFDQVPHLQDVTHSKKGSEGLLQRINAAYESTTRNPPLFLVLHNLESSALRSRKARSFLSQLVAHPQVHIIASADNIAFVSSWSFSHLFSNKLTGANTPTSMASSWLWYDITTLAPYDFELSFADRSSLAGASAQKSQHAARAEQVGGAVSVVSETAAKHILASVTQKAKKLFILLGEKQADVMDDGQVPDLQQLALEYSTLFTIARDNFVASNDTSLRALMSEFKDHSLIITVPQGSGELVWIPMRKKGLLTIVESLRREQSK